MNTEKTTDYRLSAAREFAVIALLKITLVLCVFMFSTVVVETARLYIFKADTWMTDKSREISRNILDLYR